MLEQRYCKKAQSTYTAMHVILLRILVKITQLTPPVDHACVHGDSLFENIFDKAFDSGLSHGVDASFRES